MNNIKSVLYTPNPFLSPQFIMQSDLHQTRAYAEGKNKKCQALLQKVMHLTWETQYKGKQENPATSNDEPEEGIFAFVHLSGFGYVCEEAQFSPI